MYSKEENLVEGHIKKGEARLYGEQKVNIEEDIRMEEDSQGQQGTLTQ